MSYKPTPITARILKTTKGGITQPILNMGAAVKMKIKSPAQRQRQPKARIDGEAGWAADDLARKNKTGIYGDKSYDQAYKDRDKKVYGGMDKASYTKEAKRQNASYKKTGKYDVKSSYDKPKAKVANTLKAKKGIDIKKARATSLETKLDPKVLKTQVAKVNSKKVEPSKGDIRKAVRKTKSADRKDSRAARVRQKGIDALASGNTKKALRLKRRETRIKNRAAKKRGQAASAIQPK